MSFLKKCLLLGSILLLASCVSTVPINYAPSSVLSANGTVKVESFSYLPAQAGTVKSNQIRNTAMGNVFMEKDVSTIVRDAVFAELRFVGVKVGTEGNVLTGEIQEFLIDDLGYSVDWTLRVRYLLRDESGNVIYDEVKSVERKTNKFANAFGALNETIKLSAEEIIKDEDFIRAVN